MSFRRKLLLLFALTVFLSVATVAWIVSLATRRAFEQANEAQTAALAGQFQREFKRRADDVARRVEAIAASESTTRMALNLNRGISEAGSYLNEAGPIAESHQLDFLEFVDARGTIISYAQSPAKFGYRETSLENLAQLASKPAFLKQEDLASGSSLGLFAVRGSSIGDAPLYVIGGQRLDKNSLASLELPAGMRAMLYQSNGTVFSPEMLTTSSEDVAKQTDKLAPLILQVQQQGRAASALIHWSSDPADDETVQAVPLNGADDKTLGILLIGSSRRSYVEVKRRIQSAAMLVGGAGILLAVLLSSWAAARFTRPVEDLAAAAREVAAGNLRAHVEVTSADEIGDLAEAFNRMTRDLLEQKERLIQSERVAAWRELARRLAHELKNPLFPLQLTVENLVRARNQSPAIFEEIFRESSTTLLAEIGNLKQIISRFSEFSKMPQPRFQPVVINDAVEDVVRLFQAQLEARERGLISCKMDLAARREPIAADSELLHRALSNLVLNAMDAMPQGGTLTLRTRDEKGRVRIEIADTGVGLTPEECERLFTPYYTSKQHGTGLGLAIVQSVISDHGGTISVQSQPEHGTTFLVELPRNLDKLHAPVPDGPAVVTQSP
ncbi:MAG TPA: ATP-binding protein [Terriglobales bacterium]|nr:ATP-binding protein [Terriglobales bacterium]